MDGQLLEQIQRELAAFEDHQLLALLELTFVEVRDRGLMAPPGSPPSSPDTANRVEEEPR